MTLQIARALSQDRSVLTDKDRIPGSSRQQKQGREGKFPPASVRPGVNVN